MTSTVDSGRLVVTTWANGSGIWRARVDGDCIERRARHFARQAIRGELAEREPATYVPTVTQVDYLGRVDVTMDGRTTTRRYYGER